MTDEKNLTEDEKALLASQELRDVVEASRSEERRPLKRLNDLTDEDQVIEL